MLRKEKNHNIKCYIISILYTYIYSIQFYNIALYTTCIIYIFRGDKGTRGKQFKKTKIDENFVTNHLSRLISAVQKTCDKLKPIYLCNYFNVDQ